MFLLYCARTSRGELGTWLKMCQMNRLGGSGEQEHGQMFDVEVVMVLMMSIAARVMVKI